MVGNRYWMPLPRQFQPMFQVSSKQSKLQRNGGEGGGGLAFQSTSRSSQFLLRSDFFGARSEEKFGLKQKLS